MLKNTVMSLPDKFIVFLGRTFRGHNHDYSMLKQELPPDLDWFTDINVRVDLGYLGMQLTVRSFWKFISKNWKFSFEEQRTSNAVSISLWATARLTDKRPEKTIRKTGKFFNIRKYNRL